MDIQPRMLGRAQAKARDAAVTNVRFLLGSLGAGELPQNAFDRAYLVTVLGEIPDKVAALKEIYSSLKPGGFLLTSEVVGDPHYQSLGKVRELAQQAGFHPATHYGKLWQLDGLLDPARQAARRMTSRWSGLR